MTGPLITTESLTHGTELNAVYAIARIVAETFDTEAGLDAVFRLARTIFIFDTVALYIQDEESGILEPTYARALGRGRSREAELTWGEPAATEAFRLGETILRQEDAGPTVTDRDRRRDYQAQTCSEFAGASRQHVVELGHLKLRVVRSMSIPPHWRD